MPPRRSLLIFVLQFSLAFDVIEAAITCNRAAGNVTLPSNECSGSVCLIRKADPKDPLYYDCGEGSYYSHYPDGCYGNFTNSTVLCVCRTAKCNVESFVTSSTMNANKPVIRCNGTDTATTSTVGVCAGYFCLSHLGLSSPMYYCLDDPPTLLSFAPFLGLCYRFEYGRNGNPTKSASSICVCDTDYCTEGINTLPTAPESVTVGNVTTVGIECYTNENRTSTCRGDVCFLYRNTLSGVMERGCIISQRTPEARRLLSPSYTRDVFVDYYLCNTPQCNRNIATANASIVTMPLTTANPIDMTRTTPDEWWTTPFGRTGGPIDENTTWWNSTWNDTDDDWNKTNSSTPTPGKGNNFSQQYSLLFSFLVLLFSTLLLA